MEKILIFGLNGFIGTHFQNFIIENQLFEKFSFLGVDLTNTFENPHIDYISSDLSQPENVSEILLTERPDYIINLIGAFNPQDLSRLISINSGISQSIFDTIKNHNLLIKKVLVVGSAAEYGSSDQFPIKEDFPLNPVNYYGLTKAIQSQIASFYSRVFNINISTARIFNIIGDGISKTLSIGSFIDQINNIKESGSIEVGNVYTKRDFLAVEDVIEAFWELLFKARKGEVYNICSSSSIKIDDILTHLIKVSEKNIQVVVNKNFIKSDEILDSYGDNSKLTSETSWRIKKNIFEALEALIKK